MAAVCASAGSFRPTFKALQLGLQDERESQQSRRHTVEPSGVTRTRPIGSQLYRTCCDPIKPKIWWRRSRSPKQVNPDQPSILPIPLSPAPKLTMCNRTLSTRTDGVDMLPPIYTCAMNISSWRVYVAGSSLRMHSALVPDPSEDGVLFEPGGSITAVQAQEPLHYLLHHSCHNLETRQIVISHLVLHRAVSQHAVSHVSLHGRTVYY